ncbi:MAG: Sec-independent protein translocase protein TatB [Sphingobium sp.]
MFDIGSSELLMIVIVAVVVIGPKDLPRALYKVGQLLGKARAMSRHFRSGVDAMIREVELEEMEKKWAAENRRIMQQHPAIPEALEDGTEKAAAMAGDEPRAEGMAGAVPVAVPVPDDPVPNPAMEPKTGAAAAPDAPTPAIGKSA